MNRCPDILYRCDTNSSAERRIHELLGATDLGEGWCAFHSLNCSMHEYKRWAELDFVLAGPDGIFVLEVKGGRIRCDQGIWYYKDRFGNEHANGEGPFNQARTGMHALKRLLSERYRSPLPEGTVFGWGVVFPDVRWGDDTVEMPLQVVADKESNSADGLTRYLKGLIRYWHAKEMRPVRLERDHLLALRKVIRPDIDLAPPLSARVGVLLSNLQVLTEEQDERLHFIEANPRVIITGGAGTGKTFLAIHLARRAVRIGRSVLLVVESPELASWIQKMEPDHRITITTCRALDKIGRKCDLLIVDEGQDMLDIGLLDRLGQRLDGGLDSGNWRWFMDDANQAGLRGAFQAEALEVLERGLASGTPTRLPLTQNLRNAPGIISAVKGLTGADIGSASTSDHGHPPRILPVPAGTDPAVPLARVLDELSEQDVDLDQVGIIYPQDTQTELLDHLPRRLRKKLIPLDPLTAKGMLKGKVIHGSAGRFKGLERPIVICVGYDAMPVDRTAMSTLYVALTRANFGLYMIVREDGADSFRRAMAFGRKGPGLCE